MKDIKLPSSQTILLALACLVLAGFLLGALFTFLTPIFKTILIALLMIGGYVVATKYL
jgi:hypothetical protein